MEQWKIDKVNKIIEEIDSSPFVKSCSMNDYGNNYLFSIYVTPNGMTKKEKLRAFNKAYWTLKRNKAWSILTTETPDFRGDYIIDFEIH